MHTRENWGLWTVKAAQHDGVVANLLDVFEKADCGQGSGSEGDGEGRQGF